MSKPMKILVLDNNREEKSFGSSNIVHWALRVSPPGSEVIVRRPPDHDLPALDWTIDCIIISGSITSCLELTEPWILPYDEYITEQIHRSTPMLGICYGHQTLARCLFRIHGKEIKLRKAADAEQGWAELKVTGRSKIFEGLGEQFITYESHYEEVSELPPGTVAFATTDRCAIQAFEVKDKPIYGIQFHPEYSINEAEECLAEKLKAGVRRDWILNPGKGHDLYDEQVGKAIFGNFIQVAADRRK